MNYETMRLQASGFVVSGQRALTTSHTERVIVLVSDLLFHREGQLIVPLPFSCAAGDADAVA